MNKHSPSNTIFEINLSDLSKTYPLICALADIFFSFGYLLSPLDESEQHFVDYNNFSDTQMILNCSGLAAILYLFIRFNQFEVISGRVALGKQKPFA